MSETTCKHYKRHCMFVSPCCKKIYPCRLCHDEVEVSHQLDRYLVTQIKCAECNTVQKVQKECEKCGIVFGAYFCEKCRLYDDETTKQQFHCDQCGLCRVGGKENFFHCEKCDMCLGVDLKDKHKCVENATRANCPVCMEDLHTSTEPLSVPRCNHILHKTCMQSCLKSGNYACPICNESLFEMKEWWQAMDQEVANTPMPAEYRSTYIYSLCRDCHKVSKSLFHVLGQKCQKCGSYNTCGSDKPENEEDEDEPEENTNTASNIAAEESGDGDAHNIGATGET